MSGRLTKRVETIPTLRITRALASRISAVAAKVADRIEDDKKLRCNSCGEAVAQYVRYAGKPNLCPLCGSRAKERLVLALFDGGYLNIPRGGRILHIAPSEQALMARFTAAAPDGYTAADLHPGVYEGHEVVKLDLTELANRRNQFGTFDLIYASHVLEHIPDDAAALQAIATSLNPGGEFWMLVPLAGGPTVDGDGSESVREREKRFGQWDHVRQYGYDVGKRLEAAGFEVTTLSIADVDPQVIFEAGLAADDIVWQCRVGAARTSAANQNTSSKDHREGTRR